MYGKVSTKPQVIKTLFLPKYKVESWKVVLTLSLWPKICLVTIQIEPHNEHFHIVLEISF